MSGAMPADDAAAFAAPKAPGAPRGSWRRVIAASGLPPAVAGLVARVVRIAGGNRGERRDTARELVSHFAAALAAGETPEAAIAAFGDERAAALLLRRAIRRKRGVLWHGWWWTSRAALAAVVAGMGIYGWWTVRLLTAEPTVRVDYLGKLEALSAAESPDVSGWPLLRRAYGRLRDLEPPLLAKFREINPTSQLVPLECADPTTPEWAEEERALASADEALRLLREASRSASVAPRINRFDGEDDAFFETQIPHLGPRGPANDLRLPHLHTIRVAIRWLVADARHALRRGDQERAVDSVAAVLRIGAATRGCILIEQLVAHAIISRGLLTACELAAVNDGEEGGHGLGAGALTRLAEAIRAVDPAALRFEFEGERLVFEDSLQRFFTDDGAGDGRVTRDGLKAAALDFGPGRLLGPAMMALAPSRREVGQAFTQQSLVAERLVDLPPWRWADAVAADELDAARTGSLGSFFAERQQLFWMPNLPMAAAHSASLSTGRDRAALGVALRRHRLDHGTWPARLDELVPTYLREVPRDPFDGKPVRYDVRDGVPTAWLVGPDLADDGLPAFSPEFDQGAWTQGMLEAMRRAWRRANGEPDAAGPGPRRDVSFWPPHPISRPE